MTTVLNRIKVHYLPIHPVFIRDGYICQYCGADLLESINDWQACTLDHFIPQSKDGGNRLDNLITACRYCNEQKKDMEFDTIEQARVYLAKKRQVLSERLELLRRELGRDNVDYSQR